jgi:predicted enzyme related to lactoylglutathione lyase
MDRVTSFSVPVNDMKRAKKFYGDIFGWKLVGTGMQYDYHMATTVDSDEKNVPKEAGAINGALYDRAGGDDGIRLSIKVANMDAALKGVKELGGKIMHDKMEIPGRGWFAEVGDPKCNVLMLFQDK